MFARFMTLLQPQPDWLVLDVGVTPDQALPESNFFEQWYPYQHRIVATSIEDVQNIKAAWPPLRLVKTEKYRLPFADKAFDVVFCAAVMEHVGHRYQQHQFLLELLRVARRFFIITPNRWFPIEMHTFLPLLHWLPQPWHQSVLTSLKLDFWARTENLNLLDTPGLRSLFPDTVTPGIEKVRLLGMCSNLIFYGNA